MLVTVSANVVIKHNLFSQLPADGLILEESGLSVFNTL